LVGPVWRLRPVVSRAGRPPVSARLPFKYARKITTLSIVSASDSSTREKRNRAEEALYGIYWRWERHEFYRNPGAGRLRNLFLDRRSTEFRQGQDRTGPARLACRCNWHGQSEMDDRERSDGA